MDNEANIVQSQPSKKNCSCNGVSGGAYGLGFIGALIYYIQHSSTFVDGLIGFLKALVWPAILVQKLMDFLKL